MFSQSLPEIEEVPVQWLVFIATVSLDLDYT
jgi:hypothetical protein